MARFTWELLWALRRYRVLAGLFVVALLMALLAGAGWALLAWQAKVATEGAQSPLIWEDALPIPLAAVAEPPVFDGAQLVVAIHQTSRELSLPVADLELALVDVPTQKYLRYRATLTLAADYRKTRKFMQRVLGHTSYVSFDSISCSRTGIEDAELHCALSVSAFYSRQTGAP